ncbi:TonB-dependent receptor [Pseudokordiimonas caeni]|uniref:TonB-dependent receptor n=1 Tax=Pseudokordiimonas caeni TaxID=2997908 RepID=UPI002811D5CC|nr:TonB-dependent receptor [Pseudokordiimonas caeni]
MAVTTKKKRPWLTTGASFAALLAGAGQAFAQESGDNNGMVIEEILVEAQKRAESVQDVPLAVAAFDAAFQKRVNLDDVKDLVKFTPGFAGDSKDSFIDYINIRGISTNDFGVGGDPSVGFFKNGLYQGRNGVVVTSMFDMERAEVLRGPQGFLFGRNAISGAVSLYTNKPKYDQTSGYMEMGVGQRGILEGEAAFNYGINDKVAVRLAAYHSEEDGYVDNQFDPEARKQVWHNKDALRASVGVRGESWDSTFILEYEDREQSGSVYRANNALGILDALEDVLEGPVTPRGDIRDVDADQGLGNYDIGEVLSLEAHINFDLGFASLQSITGYKDHDYDYAEDFDGAPFRYNDYAQTQSGDYFEQELRLVGQTEGPLSWYGGVSYYKEKLDVLFRNALGEDVLCGVYYGMTCQEMSQYYYGEDYEYNPEGQVEANMVDGEYSGWGAYFEATYEFSEKFDVGAGIRYTKDTKDFGINVLPVETGLGPYWMFGLTTDGFVYDSKSWDKFTPRFIARYRPNDDWMIYASLTKGYKSGGFGSFAVNLNPTDEFPDGVDENLVATPGATPNSFDPEQVTSYEVGFKGDLFDSRVRLNGNVYHYRYTDLQLNFFDAGTKIVNVGKVKAWGAEATVQAILSENLDMFVSGSYNTNEVTGAVYTYPDGTEVVIGPDGSRLPGSPKWTLAGVLAYHQPIGDAGEITGSVDFRTQSKTYGGLDNTPSGVNGGWTDVAARLGWTSNEGWSVTAYMENVFNAKYFDGTSEGSADGLFPAHGFGISRPRTVGVKLTINFGEE